MPDRAESGLLDTSVVIDLDSLSPESLPRRVSVSAITMAELAAGPIAATDPVERARRQYRLQLAEATFDAVPFDAAAARAYAQVYAAVIEAGRRPRRRVADLLIAATAMAHQLPVVTRNSEDFLGLDHLLDIIAV